MIIHTGTVEYEGYIDSIMRRAVHGWVWCPNVPERVMPVELLEGDRVLATAVADIHRADLASAHRGNGRYAFILSIPPGLDDDLAHPLSVRVKGTGFLLAGSPITYRSAPPSLAQLLPQTFVPVATIRGQVDCIDEDMLVGWAMDSAQPDRSVRLALYDHELYLTTFAAERLRVDLREAGLGSGLYGFAQRLPAVVLDGRRHMLNLRISGAPTDLLANALPFVASPADVVGPLPTVAVPEASPPKAAPAVRPSSGAATPSDGAKSTISRPASAVSCKGHLEPIVQGRMRGWVWARRDPRRRLTVEFLVDDRVVASVVADAYRGDLKKNGIGDGCYGFDIATPTGLDSGPRRTLVVRVAGIGYELINGRRTIGLGGRPVLARQPAVDDGDVTCPDYLDNRSDRDLLGALPLHHEMSSRTRMSEVRRVARLCNRLKRERLAFLADRSVTTLVMLAAATDEDGVLETLKLWGLQSHPATRVIVLASDDTISAPLARRLSGRKSVTVTSATDTASWNALCSETDTLVLARPGDILHPSLAATLRRVPATSDVIVWNLFEADGDADGGGTLYRRPQLDTGMACHATYLDTTLAIRSALAASCPPEVLRAVGRGNPHALVFWLATRQDVRWGTHPEALTVRRRPIRSTAREDIARDLPLYDELGLDLAPVFTVEETATDVSTPFVLLPARRARRVSVIVCYRNHAEATLRCLHSIAQQRLSGSIEIMLVDNQSTPDQAGSVLRGARRMFGDAAVVEMSYDAPFNHSRQNNLAAAAATGEVIVLCNNDVVLKDDTVLEEVAAWAMIPGTATVGCRIMDTAGGRGCHGHVLQPLEDDPYKPAFAENNDPSYGDIVHGVPGNSLCFAAIAADRYLELGGLDEMRFPIGYNDVDFALRCSEHGLAHVYLGHVRAQHARGSSRTGDNEDLQSLWIREAHPIIQRERLFQLQRERVDLTAARDLGLPRVKVSDDAETAAELALQARHADEARRVRLVEAMVDVSNLIGRLNDSVDQLKSAAVTD